MLSIDNVVVSVAAMHNSTTMCLERILQVVVIVIESISGAILKEEASFSLSKTGDILILGVWKIEVENAHVQMVQLEVGNVLVL